MRRMPLPGDPAAGLGQAARAGGIRRSSGCGSRRTAEFVPFLAFDAEIRTVICSTNAIESVIARIRRAIRARGYNRNRRCRPKGRLPPGEGPRPDQASPPAGGPYAECLRDVLRRPPDRRPLVTLNN
ncbi:hypothetical protein F8271_05730 [Micromonospora sp. ALFpr18c]|nr:hypothetical protein F8271_05730 [Micromonospora sp. ALFpr18c]